MAIPTLLAWWYTAGWHRVSQEFGRRLVRISHVFSLPILIRTLGAPWRRIVTYPGDSIDAKLRAMGDNLVSRVVGFTVRFLVLITALLVMLLAACYGAVLLVLWPCVPILIPALIVIGIIA